MYINYDTGVVVKWEVDTGTTFTNTNVVGGIGGGTNIQWSVVGTTRVMKMYYNTGTSEIQARYYDLSDLSEVGFTVSTGIDSEFFSVSNNPSTNEFMFVASLDYSTTNDAEQNIQGVITANGDDLNYTSRSRTYAALDQPINEDGTYTNAGDSDVLFVGTRADGDGDLHDVFVTTASTSSNISLNAAETVSFVSAIENRTTYNIKIVSHTVKR